MSISHLIYYLIQTGHSVKLWSSFPICFSAGFTEIWNTIKHLIQARYEFLIKGEKASEAASNDDVKDASLAVNYYLDKDLDAALDSFDNLFCRRCLVSTITVSNLGFSFWELWLLLYCRGAIELTWQFLFPFLSELFFELTCVYPSNHIRVFDFHCIIFVVSEWYFRCYVYRVIFSSYSYWLCMLRTHYAH